MDDVHGWNFVRGNNNPTAELVFQPASGCAPNPSKKQTYELHGTHVSGTIGALGDNGRGIVGIARDVRIMPLKVMGGPCGSGMTSNIIQAVQYAVENGANVINMSLGGGGRSEILLEQLKAAGERGILVVAAAGNEAKDNDMRPSYPASFDLATLISVAASGADDGLARFSNFGGDVGGPRGAGGEDPQQRAGRIDAPGPEERIRPAQRDVHGGAGGRRRRGPDDRPVPRPADVGYQAATPG